MEISIKVAQYIGILLDYNQKINLVSRQITPAEVEQLICESQLMGQYISSEIKTVVDAGSGNGLLGIPIALENPKKKIVLVEPKPKKAVFLQKVKENLELDNVEIANVSIEEYLKKEKKFHRAIIARGFPELEVFIHFINRGLVKEVVLITSDNKIKKNEHHLESVRKKTYNVPLRDNLKILKMENAAGE
jgi:16S rRNA (guanine(527)-N(7))-methyltransferase RsmG